MQNKFWGKYICGKKGGVAFLDVTRVDPSTKQCPAGTKPCSSKTSDENTVCYAEADHASKCPITGLKFVKKTDTNVIQEYTDEGWK